MTCGNLAKSTFQRIMCQEQAKFFLEPFAQGRSKDANLLKTVCEGLGIDPEMIFELE